MAYPVTVEVQPLLTNRNRMTTAFRAILAIPHVILVGGVGVTVALNGDERQSSGAEGGLLGAVAVVLAIVSWFTLVVAGVHLDGIRRFTLVYLRWRARALAYLLLLEDAYPPFGDGPYPVALEVAAPGPRRRLTVAFRALLAVPLLLMLIFVTIGWCIATIVAWFAILFTGRHPQAMYDFSVRALRWRLRLDAYLLLIVDDYPPFSLQ
jgi:Domain of unknown function (DUF4389)